MGNTRMFTLLLIAFTYYVMCSCKLFSSNSYQLNTSASLIRRQLAAAHRQLHKTFNTDRLRRTKPQKRTQQKNDEFAEFTSMELLDAPNTAIERIPYNDYNRIVNTLKEMLRTREEKPVPLLQRPGRRSVDADFPLWNYFIDDAGNVGMDMDDTVAIVDGVGDGLSDGSFKKSIPFKPRLGKRGESQISE